MRHKFTEVWMVLTWWITWFAKFVFQTALLPYSQNFGSRFGDLGPIHQRIFHQIAMFLYSNLPKLSTACVLYDNVKLTDGTANNY